MNIEGIPDAITEERVLEIFASLGIDSTYLHRDGIRIGWDAIECQVYATRPNPVDGRRQMYVDPSTDAPAMHRISIPVTHAGVSRG